MVFQSSGLAPFGKNSKQNIILQVVSIWYLLIALIMLVSLFLIPGYHIPNGLQWVISRLLVVAEIVTHIIVICQSYATRTHQVQIWRNLDDIQELLEQAGHTKNAQLGRKQFVKISLMLALVVSTLLIELIFLWCLYSEYMLTYIGQSVLPTIVNRFRCVQIVFYVELMREQLQCVAKRLESMAKGASNSKVNVAKLLLLYPDRGGWWKGKPNSKSKDANLRALKAAYGKIWDTSCLINDCFGWSLLAIVTQYFIHLTTQGYWIFMIISDLIGELQYIESLTDIGSVLFLLTALSQSCYASNEHVINHVFHIQ